MRKQIYFCDGCEKEIGIKKHISLSFGQYSGIAIPPKKGKNWEVVESLNGDFMHFCNAMCVGSFFRHLISKTTKFVGATQ